MVLSRLPPKGGFRLDQEVLLNLMVELAGLEEELAAAKATQAHHSRRDLHLRQLQDEYAADAAQVKADSKNVAAILRGAEGRIQDIEASLAHKKDQVTGVTDKRQYRALKSEIKALEKELDHLETQAIELMDDVGLKGQQTDQARGQRDAQADRGSAELARMDEETAKAQAAEKEIVGEIERLTAMMPEAVKRQVARLHTQHARAVVRVQDGACGGCFGRLPTQQGIDAAQGRALVRCASCARFVVRKSWK
jgi:predicted  nucleic acid-binding Zn-ribbon protein